MTQPAQTKIRITANATDLFTDEVAAYLRTQITGNLLSVCEDFSTDAEGDDLVQCMLNPTAIFAKDGPGILPKGLWGAGLDTIQSAGCAYFAASSSETVNALVANTIEDWDDEIDTSSFKVFYFAGAIVVAAEYPFEESDVEPWLRVFTDKTQSTIQLESTRNQLGVFLTRLAAFLERGDLDISVDSVA